MSQVELLTRARAIIENPQNWTKGEMARDAGGRLVVSHSPDAVCFCAVGALRRAAYELCIDRFPSFYTLQKWCGTEPVPLFNDTHTHADVLALYDRAIEAARAASAEARS